MMVSELLRWAAGQLKGAGVDKPGLEAELLLAETLAIPRLELILRHREIVGRKDINKFKKYIVLRKKRIPAAYILKNAFFYGLKLQIEKGVLIPRPETELLVEAVIKRISGPIRILDIGVGSGAIATALALNLKQAQVYGTDISGKALAVAKRNVCKHKVAGRVKLKKGSLLAGWRGKFAVIVSNPPYISDRDLKSLQPEVAFEPRAALSGGKDGMDFYRRIIPLAKNKLNESGFLALEVGYNQAGAVAKMLREHGFGKTEVLQDYSGMERIIISWTKS